LFLFIAYINTIPAIFKNFSSFSPKMKKIPRFFREGFFMVLVPPAFLLLMTWRTMAGKLHGTVF
jgi:hypothetical protein